ncbi:MAG: ubiquinone/menaquinone biosynthesis methyltransferase [Gemmatimonadaceae bacterium]
MPLPLPLPSPQDLERRDLAAELRDAARKQRFVTPMFEHIAPRYDAFTRLFSFGMDAGWKREIIAWMELQAPTPEHVLDVACGTGDLSFAAAARFPDARVTGVDAAERMIAVARSRWERTSAPRVSFAVGDLTATALPDASVDAVLAGYAFRNIPRLDDGLREVARVLRPGGWLYSLDFYKPGGRLWRPLFLRYLHVAGSALGWWWHRAPVMYAYIAESIDAYVDASSFTSSLAAHGLLVQRRRDVLGGGVALHAARRA